MTSEIKNQIRDAAVDYMTAKGINQTDLAGLSKLNGSYLSSILKGNYELITGDNQVMPIGDKWFVQLAETVGYRVNREFWPNVVTPQFMRMIAELKLAKSMGVHAILIGESGSGKSLCAGLFLNNNPSHTYLITINSLMRVGDVINVLYDKLRLTGSGSRALKLASVIMKLRDIKRQGGSPMLIFDESENMDNGLLKMTKGLFDGIDDYAAIVLVGTDQLIYKLERNKKANKEGGPQLYRRFKSGIRYLDAIDRRFKAVWDKLAEDGVVIEPGLRKLLCELCENYGELNNYLEPAIREAYEKGVALTEDFFRVKYNMRR
jgi:DNA transposition AAA+ family ATPase